MKKSKLIFIALIAILLVTGMIIGSCGLIPCSAGDCGRITGACGQPGTQDGGANGCSALIGGTMSCEEACFD